MKKLLKNPLFYVMYFIPQLIMTHAVSTFNKTFSNGQTCFADYYELQKIFSPPGQDDMS